MTFVMSKCLIAVFLAAIFSIVLASRLTMDIVDAQISLEEFKTLMETQYGKKYSNVQEAELRHAIFKANLAHITDHNALFLAGGHSYWRTMTLLSRATINQQCLPACSLASWP